MGDILDIFAAMNDFNRPPDGNMASEFLAGQSRFPQRILVVEDEGDLRQLNAEVLLDAGYQVDGAEDGAAAWAALQIHHYDLLLTDQFLPKLSGVELLKKIHTAPDDAARDHGHLNFTHLGICPTSLSASRQDAAKALYH